MPVNRPVLGTAHEVIIAGFQQATGLAWAPAAYHQARRSLARQHINKKKAKKTKHTSSTEADESSGVARDGDASFIFVTDKSSAVYRCNLATREEAVHRSGDGGAFTGIEYLRV